MEGGRVMKEFIEKLIGRLEARKKIILSHKIIDAEDESMIFAYNETINIVNELAEKYKSGHFGCNFNGQHEKCNKCELNCKHRNTIWFGIKEEFGKDTNVTSKDDWIPCSERLPEKDMWCLATFESGNVDKIQYLVTNNWGWNGMRGDNKVIAWMPLPAPYKEGVTENE